MTKLRDRLIVDLGGVGQPDQITTVNINPATNPHYVADITAGADQLSQIFALRSIDKIDCIHTLEHLDPSEVIPTLAYWRRFLKPGGKLMVITPDTLQIISDWYRVGISMEVLISVLYGNHDLTTPMFPEQMHRWGWTVDTLIQAFQVAGFVNVCEHEGYYEHWTYDYEGFDQFPEYMKWDVRNARVIGEAPMHITEKIS